MEFVGRDYVVAADMHREESKRDFIFAKKSVVYYSVIIPKRRPMVNFNHWAVFCFDFTPPHG